MHIHKLFSICKKKSKRESKKRQTNFTETSMEERGRGRLKRRAECEHEQEFQDYPYFPSSPRIPRSRQATKDLNEDESDDRSVEIISEYEFLRSNKEVNSRFSDHAFEYVDGLRVKAEFAPVLRAIFEKHGNIVKGNNVKSPLLLSSLLERICRVYRRLEQGKLTREELEGVASELRIFERRKLRVGWIVERVGEYVKEISSTKAEGGNGDEMKQEIGVSVRRRSRRERKEPGWHKDFCPSHLITTI